MDTFYPFIMNTEFDITECDKFIVYKSLYLTRIYRMIRNWKDTPFGDTMRCFITPDSIYVDSIGTVYRTYPNTRFIVEMRRE